MENEERAWHANFKRYTEKMVNHPNYKGLFFERAYDGNVKWVVTGKSDKGLKRKKWWDEQCLKHGIPIQKGNYAVIARLIHPTKKKVCQCCGRELSVFYEYPNKVLLKKINNRYSIQIEQTQYTIREIISRFCKTKEDLSFFESAFYKGRPITSEVEKFTELRKELIENIYTNFVYKCQGPLSPGAMSNCPDRFDGFHSDGLCCRERTDKGRHGENMATYTQDRRAYEEWADGDFNLANRLMGEFRKDEKLYTCPKCGKRRKMTADHIGPISLGFCHSINFAPLCDSCNSSKNNRLSKDDVDALISYEKQGEQVISWHAKTIWDMLKKKVKNDDDARKMSSVMLQCHHNVLRLFAIVYDRTGRGFLMRFLHPEYAYCDYRFENFNPFKISKVKVISKPLASANKKSNAERYLRIAFDSLKEFNEKSNRKTRFVVDGFKDDIDALVALIKANEYRNATSKIKNIINSISKCVMKTMWND